MGNTTIEREKHMSEADLTPFLKKNGTIFNKLSSRKQEILITGCQLLFLTPSDVLYIAEEEVSEIAAENRLRQKRLGSFGR